MLTGMPDLHGWLQAWRPTASADWQTPTVSSHALASQDGTQSCV